MENLGYLQQALKNFRIDSFNAAFSKESMCVAVQPGCSVFQAFHVGPIQPAILGLPLVVRDGADAIMLPDLVVRATGISLLQDCDHLDVGELRFAHGNLLAWSGNCA